MKRRKTKNLFAEVIIDYTEAETGNVAIDAYPDNDPNSENGRTVAWVTPDGEIIKGANPEIKDSDLECSLVKNAIKDAKNEQAERKQKLLDNVIKDLKQQFEQGDYTVLDELLKFIPSKNLIQALPEEQWQNYSIKIK